MCISQLNTAVCAAGVMLDDKVCLCSYGMLVLALTMALYMDSASVPQYTHHVTCQRFCSCSRTSIFGIAVSGTVDALQLFNGATLALLDEATSALEEEAERELYQLLMNMPGLTLVSTESTTSYT
jgi:hypothetical protein